jgi:hypothetical protein
MVVKILKGLSGYRADKTPYRYSKGSIENVPDEIAFSLINAGQATVDFKDDSKRPVAYAEAPRVKDEVIHAVVKRRKRNV